MGFQCGIVGLPNVGKSTLFNALTRAGAAAANYPFCTIDPNVGVVPMPDPRLDRLAEIYRPKQVVPTQMRFVDIAGLVAGASKGEGLGNKFLAHVREVEAIAHVVRLFHDDDVAHVAGRIDPRDDVETIDTELLLADLETVQRRLDKVSRQAKGNRDLLPEVAFLEKVEARLSDGAPPHRAEAEAERDWLAACGLLSTKPTLYVANLDERQLAEPGPELAALVEVAAARGAEVIPICAAVEAELVDLDPADRQEMLAAYGLEEPGLHRLIRAGYRLLGLVTFLTGGPEEARAWTIPAHTAAPAAAGTIHSDIERGFIRAEVMTFHDLDRLGSPLAVKEAGLLRIEGRDYIIQDGDVVYFRFNV
ncbi:MAG: redox-regulated ATPase YchF [Nitrospirota bacterium]|jgi:GTP-binding protein YchF